MFVDSSGLDAMVVNHGGIYGHTSFVTDNPNGGYNAYHFYAKAHYNNESSSNLRAIVADRVEVWGETSPNVTMKDYLKNIEMQQGFPPSIRMYAVGTSADDARIIKQLDREANADAGYYSAAFGRQCHNQSTRWFRDYAGWDSKIHALNLIDRDPSFDFYALPSRIEVTKSAYGEDIRNIVNYSTGK